MIVIPAIDVRGGKLVQLIEGDPSRETVYDVDPVAAAVRFQEQGAPLLHVIDLDAAFGAGSNADTVAAICAEVSIPVQVGGGLRSAEAIGAVQRLGAARMVVGSKAADPRFVRDVLDRYGERVVVAVDVRDGFAMIHGWRDAGPPVDQLLRHLDRAGCRRYLVTAIAADGRLEGPDLDLYQGVLELTDRPVLASGGISSTQDLKALSDLGIEGAVVGKALYEGNLDLAEAFEAVWS